MASKSNSIGSSPEKEQPSIGLRIPLKSLIQSTMERTASGKISQDQAKPEAMQEPTRGCVITERPLLINEEDEEEMESESISGGEQ